jgi:uncharacterized protein YkwD
VFALVWFGGGLAGAHAQEAAPRSPRTANQPKKESDAPKTAKPIDPMAAALLDAHNRERKLEKREPLSLSPELCEAALVHAKDMAAHHNLDHTGSDGSKVTDRIKRTGYAYVRVGENIAFGQTSINQVMTTWLDSPPHREHMLGDFTQMGGARIDDDQNVSYWCVTFGVSIPRLKPTEAAAAVLKEWNRQRKEQKKPPLKAEPRLARAAMAATKAMAEKDSSKIEGDPFKLIGDRGPQGRELRLMVSVNIPTAVEAAKSLLEDNAAELARFGEVGVGYAVAKSGRPYWCAIFSRSVPRSRSDRVRENEEKNVEP